jgi:hypothetical protein
MFLGDKSETSGIFKTFAIRSQREYNTQFLKIQSDNGTEFKNMNIEEWCDEEGIKHEFSTTYTPQQYGVVEHKNKILITLARAMLDDYGTPEKFWAKAINTACHASNRVYIHRLLEKTPYKLFIGKKPNISYFCVVGCKCFIYKKKSLGKFECRCDEGFFLGYASNSKAYRVFNKISRLIEETCDVEFDESNGSQGEIVGYENVGDDEVIEALKNMSIGDIKPKEVQENSDKGRQDSSTSTPSTSMVPQVDEDEEKDDTPSQLDVQSPTTQAQNQHEPIVQPQVQAQDDSEPSQQAPQDVPQVKHGRISKDHPIDQVIGSPSTGVRTHSKKHASFCEHYSFVSCGAHVCRGSSQGSGLGDSYARRVEQLHS